MEQALTWSDIVVAIPTMPERAGMLRGLLARLEEECADAVIAVHDHRCGTSARADFPETIDAALALRRPWVLCVEDDVWPCAEFGSRAVAAMGEGRARGAAAMTLFSRSRADVAMFRRGETWRTQSPSSFCMAQAVALRAENLRGFSAWAPSWYETHPQHGHAADLLLGAWLSTRRVRMLAHIPSLVQHRPCRSTLPNRRGHRMSETYRLAFGEVP